MTSGISQAIYEKRQLIWRNLPSHASTFGECLNKCGRSSGRGSGECIACARDALAKLVGEDMANDYVSAVRHLRELETAMEDR